MRNRCLLVALSAVGTAHAQVYTPSPNWQSADMQVSTGAAFVDLNRDGWLDLVIANGNDIHKQRTVVYYNTGAGTLQISPGWQSSDIAFNGHLDVADVNADGWPDVAVAVLLAQGGPAAKLYMNNNGTLGTTPAWTSPVIADSFGVAFGDMNNDGRPDLSVASGDAYNNDPERNCVYLNVAGALSPTVSWETATEKNMNAALWLDASRDGKLDLCLCGSNTDTFVYHNLGSALETTATWRTNDIRNQFCLMATYGDVTGDGRPDLVTADNNQLFSGSGRFRMYTGAVAGDFATVASWTYFDGYASAVTLGDIDADGDLDLVSGAWFDRTRYFLNTGAGFPATPTWTSAGTSTVEKLVLGDVDNRARRVRVQTFAPSGSRRLFELGRRPVEDVTRVIVDGADLPLSQWTFSREHGWVAIGVTPLTSVRVVYIASTSLDLAVSNWDDNRPNYLYFNQRPAPCAADFNEDGFGTGDDFDAFVNAFEAGDETADINIDGFVNGVDFDDFSVAFGLGC